MGVRRELPAEPGICVGVCYKDMVPKLDGQFLFGDYETTLGYIKEANSYTAKSTVPLYTIWILSESVEDLITLVERDLHKDACLSQAS